MKRTKYRIKCPTQVSCTSNWEKVVGEFYLVLFSKVSNIYLTFLRKEMSLDVSNLVQVKISLDVRNTFSPANLLYI